MTIDLCRLEVAADLSCEKVAETAGGLGLTVVDGSSVAVAAAKVLS